MGAGVFTLDLVLHVVGHWFVPFWMDAWNVMDFTVISVSLVLIFLVGDSSFLKACRTFRVLRVIRLMKNFQKMRMIFTALGRAAKPIANAFFILFVVTACYAVLGVQIFADKLPHAFGRFLPAFFTMFQCTTGDSWSSLARVLMGGEGEPQFDLLVFAFFVSYAVLPAPPSRAPALHPAPERRRLSAGRGARGIDFSWWWRCCW